MTFPLEEEKTFFHGVMPKKFTMSQPYVFIRAFAFADNINTS
jgi:hypothetical protein